MSRFCGDEAAWFALLLPLALGCASAPPVSARDAADANDTGAALGAKSDGERALLGAVPNLPTGTGRRIGEATVIADAPYAAASGRTCRALHISRGRAPEQGNRLTCSNGKAWFFVPEVFGDEKGARGD